MPTIEHQPNEQAGLQSFNNNNGIETEAGNRSTENSITGSSDYSIKRLSIIIPAYNEEKTIGKILNRINEVKLIRNIEKEVIIVNDCSKDNTEEKVYNYMK